MRFQKIAIFKTVILMILVFLSNIYHPYDAGRLDALFIANINLFGPHNAAL
jgi:hypothetical protein